MLSGIIGIGVEALLDEAWMKKARSHFYLRDIY